MSENRPSGLDLGLDCNQRSLYIALAGDWTLGGAVGTPCFDSTRVVSSRSPDPRVNRALSSNS